jgi:hypothetical protein
LISLGETMLATNRGADPKSKRMLAMGCACISIGLALQLFIHPSTPGAQIFVHATSGFLLGLSLVLILFGVRPIRHRRRNCE